MGSTPNFALPYPEPGDTPNVPRDVKSLAEVTDGALSSNKAAIDTNSQSITQVDTKATSAQGTANGAVSVNNTQNTAITALQHARVAATGANVVVMASGWTLSLASATVSGPWCALRVIVVRSGANITAGANGSITDVLVCAIKSPWRPPSSIAVYAKTSSSGGGVVMESDGQIYLTHMTSTSVLTTNQYLTMFFMFPMGTAFSAADFALLNAEASEPDEEPS